jgi:hypothetical protein
MNKCQILLALFIGIHIGIRLPAAKRGVEEFKNSLGSKVVEGAAVYFSSQIINTHFTAPPGNGEAK